MSKRRNRRATLGTELRRKFKTPREALAALGLDQRLLDVPRLALDSASGGTSSRAELEKLLATVLSGHQYQRACQLLNGAINAKLPEAAEIEQEAQDDENEAEAGELERRRDRIADFLRERGLGEDDIEEGLPLIEEGIRDAMRKRRNGHDRRRHAGDRDADLPRNAIKGGLRGDAAERKLARDERRRQAFDERFGTARLSGSAIECHWGDQPRPVTLNGTDMQDFNERFPEAARVGVA